MSKKLFLLTSFVLVLGLVLTGMAKADLVGWWKFDEGSGTIAKDSSGNGNDGTIHGAQTTAGQIGKALLFDEINNDYVVVTDFAYGPEFTVAFWFKSSGNAGTVYQYIFSHAPYNASNSVNIYFCENEGENAGCLRTALKDVDDTDQQTGLDVAPGFADGNWHHYALTVSSGMGANVYVDGVPQASLASQGGDAFDPASDLYFGGRVDLNDQRFFGGALDDVRVYRRALEPEEILSAIVGRVELAADPIPATEARDVPRDAVLSWSPGEYADTHNVYFGMDLVDVNDASVSDSRGVLVSERQAGTTYDPGRREFGTTYYWRIDEVNAPPTSDVVFKGDVWSFTTERFAYPVQGITATASSSEEAKGPENTVNASGLDANDLHSLEPTDMWLSSTEPLGVWIEFQFDKVYKLHQMWVWNSNQSLERVIGLGFKDVTIEYSVNGTDYTTLSTTAEFARASGADGYAHNTTIDFNGLTAKYVRLTSNSNWGGIMPQYGLSEVRFFYIPVRAREPNPDSGATDVDVDVVLGFRAGREAAQHDMYFSSNEQAVIDGNASVISVTETSYGPLSLDLDQTYYWKINEVNMAETPSTFEGDLWNFTTREFLIVDDFESYNDLDTTYPESNRIFNVWIDGYGIATNGSLVGYGSSPFCEKTIVHSGTQSMPFFYSNTGGAAYSEAELPLSPAQNWTEAQVKTLAVHFHGAEGNTGQLYVKINGTKVPYDGQASNLALTGWQAWNIDLASSGASLQNVTKLAVGIDGNGASGTLLFDDIRLYRLAP